MCFSVTTLRVRPQFIKKKKNIWKEKELKANVCALNYCLVPVMTIFRPEGFNVAPWWLPAVITSINNTNSLKILFTSAAVI